MHTDFTLVIPTYNRPEQLNKLLAYLGREQAKFPILVLDSSSTDNKEKNQQIIKTLDLPITYIDYDQNTKPFDKFHDGVSRVKTSFCQLCADDDLILVKELEQCVAQLKQQPDASVVHGYYFTFLECSAQGGIDIPQILYYSPTIDAAEPLARLRNLFSQYQALTYGIYRTPILANILKTIKNVDRILARELLASALAVVYGKAIRLPLFTHGRNQGASESYQYWHPLEWLARTPQGLFGEYKLYRNTLVEEIIKASDNKPKPKEEVERLVDLIHMHYLLRHAPQGSYEFLMDNIMQGKSVDELWPAHAVQIPLIHAAHATRLQGQSNQAQEPRQNPTGWLERIISKISKHKTRPEEPKNDEPPALPVLENVTTSVRSYRLHRNFLSPNIEGLTVKADHITRLTMALDNYY